MEGGMTLQEIRAKYCKDWMAPFSKLKFVSIHINHLNHIDHDIYYVNMGCTMSKVINLKRVHNVVF